MTTAGYSLPCDLCMVIAYASSIVRDIPVYEGWLTDGEQVRKASNLDSYEQAVRDILYEEPREKVRRRIRAGRALAEEHSMRATGEKLYQIEQKLL